jgi:hypothetical protein
MNMEHYYVVNGNEYGVDLYTKKIFTNIEDATKHFEEVKYDDFGCKLVYVNSSGVEKDIEVFIND